MHDDQKGGGAALAVIGALVTIAGALAGLAWAVYKVLTDA